MPHLPTKTPIQPLQKDQFGDHLQYFPQLQSQSEDLRNAEATEASEIFVNFKSLDNKKKKRGTKAKGENSTEKLLIIYWSVINLTNIYDIMLSRQER